MIRASTNAFLSELINSHLHYLKHARKYAGGLTLSVVYGYQAHNADDRFLKQAEVCLEIIVNDITAGSGIWPVDLIPLLEYLPSWMPGASFKKKAAVWNTKLKEFAEGPFEEAKTAVVSRFFSFGHAYCIDLASGRKMERYSPLFAQTSSQETSPSLLLMKKKSNTAQTQCLQPARIRYVLLES